MLSLLLREFELCHSELVILINSEVENVVQVLNTGDPEPQMGLAGPPGGPEHPPPCKAVLWAADPWVQTPSLLLRCSHPSRCSSVKLGRPERAIKIWAFRLPPRGRAENRRKAGAEESRRRWMISPGSRSGHIVKNISLRKKQMPKIK